MELKDLRLGDTVIFRKTRCKVVAYDPVTKNKPVLMPMRSDRGIGNGHGNCYTVKNIRLISPPRKLK